VIIYVESVRRLNYDGLVMWNLLKNPLSELFGNTKYDWEISREQIEEEYGLLDSQFIGHLDETPDMDHDQWAREHFLVQHVRILFKTPRPTLVKYLQVAYNTGQLKAELDMNPDFYEKHMDKVRTFMNINRYIPSEIMQKPISELQTENNKMIISIKDAITGVFNALNLSETQNGGAKTLNLNFSGTSCI